MENPYSDAELIKVDTLQEELQRLSDPSVSPQLLDFIEFLLVIDPSKISLRILCDNGAMFIKVLQP